MNITLVSYRKQLDFGIVACRRSIPQVQRIIDYLEEALVELEELAGLRTAPRRKPPTRAKSSAATKPKNKPAAKAKAGKAATRKPAARAKPSRVSKPKLAGTANAKG